MGKSEQGTLFSWEEVQEHTDYVKNLALKQFIRLFRLAKDKTYPIFKWGDETEYMMVRLDHSARTAHLIMNNSQVVSDVERASSHSTRRQDDHYGSRWSVEMAAYMVESCPEQAFGGRIEDLLLVERNISLRREQLNQVLSSNRQDKEDICLTMSSFPRTGLPGAVIPSNHLNSGAMTLENSSFELGEYIHPSPRTQAILENIMKRSQRAVAARIPVFEDTGTDMENIGVPLNWKIEIDSEPGHVVVGPVVLGAGVAAMQLTLQGSSLEEAKLLHDQLVPIAPIMLALSAAAPVFHGYMGEWDSRWNVLEQVSDCRTPEERNGKDKSVWIPKSRFGPVNGYVSTNNDELNDVSFPYDETVYRTLIQEGIDPCFAKHTARQFTRDPLYLTKEGLHQNQTNMGHLQNILGTNWQAVRLKMPQEDMGWRVEFRTMDAQLTHFEQAAYLIFVVLLTRAVISMGLDFAIPISKVDENMYKAPRRGALTQQRFAFRANPFKGAEKNIVCEMTADMIVNGGTTEKGVNFPGLVPLIRTYLASIEEVDTGGFGQMIDGYLDLISSRASGKMKTTAQWIRQFVMNHSVYEHDSIVTDRINYDLLNACSEISRAQMKTWSDLSKAQEKACDGVARAQINWHLRS